MAALTRINPVRVNNRYGASPNAIGGIEQSTTFIEAASQTWAAGALVYLTSGAVAAWVAGAAFLGQAMQAATGVTGATVPNLETIRPGDRFSMNLYSATPATAVVARTLLGNRYKLNLISGIAVCDLDTTAVDAATPLPWVKIVDLNPDDLASQVQYGRVIVEFGQQSLNTSTAVATTWMQAAG